MRRLSNRLLQVQPNSKASENMLRSCSNIVFNTTPTTTSRLFTTSHSSIRQQEEKSGDSFIQPPSNIPATPPTQENKMNVVDGTSDLLEIIANSSRSKDELVSDVVKFEYTQSNKSQLIQKNIDLLFANDIITLSDWNQLSSQKKDKYPDFLVEVLDKACQQVFGAIDKLIDIASVNRFIDTQTKKAKSIEPLLEGSHMPSDFFPYSCNISAVNKFWNNVKLSYANRGCGNVQHPFLIVHTCGGVSGLGKTTFVRRGIDAIVQTDLYQNDKDVELKRMFESKIYLPISTTELGQSIPKGYDDLILGRALLYAYIRFHLSMDITFTDVPSVSTKLVIDTLKSRYKQNIMIIAHIDDVQNVIENNWNDVDRRNSWIYGAVNTLHNFLVQDKEVFMVPFVSGTNAVGIEKLKVVSGVAYENYYLSLLDVDDQITVMNSIVSQDSQIDKQNSYNLRLFLTLMSGHPIILGLFMCYASNHCLTESKGRLNHPVHRVSQINTNESQLPFSSTGWKLFVSNRIYNSKEDMWRILERMSKRIFSTRFSYYHNPLLGGTNNFDLCMAVLYHCLLSTRYVDRSEFVLGGNKETFGDLEDKGAVLLHTDEIGLRPVLPCFFIAEMITKITRNGRCPSFPLLNFRPTIHSGENEENDVSVEILRWFGKFNFNGDKLFYRDYLLVKPNNWGITKRNERMTLGQIVSQPEGVSVGILNAKGAPMADGCLVFRVIDHPTIQYYSVLLQPKFKASKEHHIRKKEDVLSVELGKVLKSDLPSNVAFEFSLITDAVDVDDQLPGDKRSTVIPVNIFVASNPNDLKRSSNPNVQKKDQKEFYGQIISIWKELKVNWSRNEK